MNACLLLLSFVVIVYSQTTSRPKNPPPPFLSGLSTDAKREFSHIAGNRKLTRLEIRKEVYTWSDKYGVRSQVEEYLTKKNKAKAEQKERIQTAINQLPEAFNKLHSLGEDDNLTQEDADNQIKQSMSGYSWELKELLRLAGPGNLSKRPSTAAAAA